jgi:protein disulfide-isomerase A6
MVQQSTSKRSLNGAYLRPIADIYSNANFFFFPPHRLESILSKRNLASAKLDELKIKLNILKTFVAEDLKETMSREEAEL